MAIPKKKVSNTKREPTTTSLFSGINLDDETFKSSDEKTLKETTRFKTEYIELDKIVDNDNNKFRLVDTKWLENSIKMIGQVQPIVLIPMTTDGVRVNNYMVKAGSRRFNALKNIIKKAKEQKDIETEKRFSKAFAIILPVNATEDEIERVYEETNTTARPLSISETFMHFDRFFERNEKGDLINLPKNTDKVRYISNTFDTMGFQFGPTKVKEYISIYTAHNPRIKSDFEDGFLNRQQAVIVSRMPANLQDEVMDKFKQMTDKDIREYLKVYNLEKKSDKLTKKIKGIEAVGDTLKISVKIKTLSKMKEIVFADENEKTQLLGNLKDIKEYIETVEKLVK